MVDPEFFDIADEFIRLANELNKKWASTRVSSALLYAAARYNAFNFFASDGEKERKQPAVSYYCEQYRRMLEDNMADLRREERRD